MRYGTDVSVPYAQMIEIIGRADTLTVNCALRAVVNQLVKPEFIFVKYSDFYCAFALFLI